MEQTNEGHDRNSVLLRNYQQVCRTVEYLVAGGGNYLFWAGSVRKNIKGMREDVKRMSEASKKTGKENSSERESTKLQYFLDSGLDEILTRLLDQNYSAEQRAGDLITLRIKGKNIKEMLHSKSLQSRTSPLISDSLE